MAALILIVDDEWLNRDLMETMLTAHDYKTITAANGQKAVEQAAEHHPNLIIMDIRMPDTDGYATTALLKANPATQNIPVLLISGLKTGKEERERASEVGAADVLQRGVEMDTLMQHIRKHLSSE